jgi:very-short-patch-repair endonuclease
MLSRARELRREMTPAERILWRYLRNGQIDGAQFRRQHAVGTYIVDFLCARSKLVIEVDGDGHADQIEFDEQRTQWLNEQKHYRVLRFTNDEVRHNIAEVLEKIREAL